jgi:hypothetical protein
VVPEVVERDRGRAAAAASLGGLDVAVLRGDLGGDGVDVGI